MWVFLSNEQRLPKSLQLEKTRRLPSDKERSLSSVKVLHEKFQFCGEGGWFETVSIFVRIVCSSSIVECKKHHWLRASSITRSYNFIKYYFLKFILTNISLLAFTAKYGVPTNQWTWLCQALLEVSMTTIALWICVCADDWAAELAVKASNAHFFWKQPKQRSTCK